VALLPKQHAICLLLNNQHSRKAISHHIASSFLIPKQQAKIKSFIIDINNYLNEVISSFDSLNKELSLGFCLINTFPDCFSFILAK